MLLNAFSILIRTEEKEVLLFQKLQWKTVFTMFFFQNVIMLLVPVATLVSCHVFLIAV